MSGFDRHTAGSGPATFGFDGAEIDLSSEDYAVPDAVKALVVVRAGDVVCRPVHAAANITVTQAPSGFVLPWHCAAIVKAGTSAKLATVIG